MKDDSATKRREGYVPTRHGRVWYRITGGETGGATGQSEAGRAPLLLVHGGPGMTSDYLEPLLALADERPVVVYDQIGGGRSDRPEPPPPWSVELFLGELWKVRQALGLPRLHVWGHSWGSQLAVEYALTRPEGVLSWSLSNPPLSMPRWLPDLARYRAELPAEVRAVLDRCESTGTTGAPEYGAATRVFYERHFCRRLPWPEALRRTLSTGNDALYQELWGPSEFTMTGVLKDYDRAARLHEIAGPALFLCGRYDEATPETTAWYASLVAGAELAIIEEASHTPWIENPEPYLTALRDFLRRADAP